MKKLLCLITTVLSLLLLLVGCSSEDGSLENYALVKEDGAYYVIMDREDPTKDEIGYLPVPHIDFDSFEEMIADFQNGDFSEHELDFLARHPRTEDGKILVPNLDELIEPVLPDDVGDYEIIQLGDSYYQGQDVLVSVLDMDSRPSIDWITSFAVKPYEG